MAVPHDKPKKLRKQEERHDASQKGETVEEVKKMGRARLQALWGPSDRTFELYQVASPSCTTQTVRRAAVCRRRLGSVVYPDMPRCPAGLCRATPRKKIMHPPYVCAVHNIPVQQDHPARWSGSVPRRRIRIRRHEAEVQHVMVYSTRRSTDSDISYYLEGLEEGRVSPNSLLNARRSISVLLEPTMRYILAELKRARFIQIDETPYKYRKRRGYVWVVRTDRVCMILALPGRSGNDILPFVMELLDKPVTVDGYSVYLRMFKILQRCWAHILRDAEDVCISHRDIPYYRELYRSLRMIFHRAKEVAARTAAAGGADMTTCRQFADEVRRLAARYGNLKFAGTLHAAADNLFTFLRYPGMPPTNNGSERDIRDWVVPIREVSHKFMTERGMRVFSILQSFAATCSKLNLNVGKSFLKVLHDPTHNIVREGLSAVSATPLLLPICVTPPMLPAPLPAALPALPPPRPALPAPLPAASIPAKPSYAATPQRLFHWVEGPGRPALLVLLTMSSSFMQDAFELVPPPYYWEYVIDQQALPIHGSLIMWQDRAPQAGWGG